MIVCLIAVLLMAVPVWAEESKVHFHGYGELHLASPQTGKDTIDFHRMVWGLSYQFDDKVSLHTEIDFEHAGQEMELEYAYLDFNINPLLNVRAGAILMPVGPLNEFHEPPLFYSVERPRMQNTVIPTTWQEGGIGLFGASEAGLKYRLYLVSGLNASGFSKDKGIRGGRNKLSAGKASTNNDTIPTAGDDFAIVGRLEYAGIPGLNAGLSGYKGDADQGVAANVGVDVMIKEADLRYRIKGLDIQAVYAQVDIGNANQLPVANGVGEKIVGWFGEVAYRIGRFVPFARMSELNTQDVVPTGVTADKKNDLSIATYGLAFYPIPEVAFKADWENVEDGNGDDAETVNVGVAYMF